MVLHETRREKDLRVIVNSKLKWVDQVNQAAVKATTVLCMLKRTFVHWSADLFLRLYPAYIKYHLESCSQSGTHTERRTLEGSSRSKEEPPNWFLISSTSTTSTDCETWQVEVKYQFSDSYS